MTVTVCRVWRADSVVATWADDPALTARLAAARKAVDAAWSDAVAGQRIAAGRRLHVTAAEETAPGRLDLKCATLPTRYVVARRRGVILPEPVHPLGVAAITLCSDGQVLLGRRPDAAVRYPGWLELIPSVPVEDRALTADGTVDLTGQLLSALDGRVEALSGTRPDCRPLGLVHDLESEAYVAVFSLEVDARGTALRAALAGHGYDRVHLMRQERLLPRLEKLTHLVPSSLAAARLL